MRLPNFDNFEPFSALRKQMEARPAAHLELVKIDRLNTVDVETQAIDWPDAMAPAAHEKIDMLVTPPVMPVVKNEAQEAPPAAVMVEAILPEPAPTEEEPVAMALPQHEEEMISQAPAAAPKPITKAKQRPKIKRVREASGGGITLKRLRQLVLLVALNMALFYGILAFIANLNTHKREPVKTAPPPVKTAPEVKQEVPVKPPAEPPKPQPVAAAPVAIPAPAKAAPVVIDSPAPVSSTKPIQSAPVQSQPTQEIVKPAKVPPVPAPSAPVVITPAAPSDEPSPPLEPTTDRPTAAEPETPPADTEVQSGGLPPSWIVTPVPPTPFPQPEEPVEMLREVPPEVITERPFDDVRRKAGSPTQ